jgi:hypothetical protein
MAESASRAESAEPPTYLTLRLTSEPARRRPIPTCRPGDSGRHPSLLFLLSPSH